MSTAAVEPAGPLGVDDVHDSRAVAGSVRNPHYARRWLILALLALAQLMVVLDATIVNIALPTAQHRLGFNDNDRQWIVTAYSLSFGGLLLLGGRIADHFGRKWTLIVGLTGFAVASAIGGASVNFVMFAVSRAVQGAFGALLAPACLALVTSIFTDPDERGEAFSVYGAIAGGGTSVGLMLGGVLTEYISWRWTMYVNILFAAVTVFGCLRLLHHEQTEERPKLDFPGTVLVTAGIFSLVYGFSRAASDGWSDTLTIGFLVASGVLLAVFVWLQTRVANPLLPLRILLDRNRGGAFLSMLLASGGLFAVFLFLTYFLQQNLHYSSVRTGLAFLPLTAVLMVTTHYASTWMMDHLSPRFVIPTGMVVCAVGLYLLTRIGPHSSYTTHILIPIVLIGLGVSAIFAPAFSVATLGVHDDDSGVASAAVNVMQQVGGSVGTALFNTIAGSAVAGYLAGHAAMGVSPALRQELASIHSYQVAFWVACGVFAGGAVLVGAILRSGIVDVAAEEHKVGLL